MSAKSCHDPRCGNELFRPSMRMPGSSDVANIDFMEATEILLTYLLLKGCGITADTVPLIISSALLQDLPSS